MTPGKIICIACALIASAAMGAQRIEDAYIAPVNHLIFSLVFPDGSSREFERDPFRRNGLRSLGEWDGDIHEDGRISVRRRERGVLKEIFSFDRGRLIGHELDGRKTEFAYESPRGAPKKRYAPLEIVDYENAREMAENYSKREMSVKWSGTGRLAFPYVNPNFSGALYAQLALLSLMMLFVRHKAAKISAVLLFCVFSVLLALTGSRGAMLGMVCALAAAGAFRFRTLVKSRLFWGVAIAAVAGAAAWLATGGYQNLVRGFTSQGTLDWSNAIRMDMLKAAPLMMLNAPGGWEFCHVGKAYLDWYQPVEMFCLTGSLMNDHISILVKCGWVMRFVYLFALFAVLGAALTLAKRNPLPLAVVSGFFVMALFNPVFTEWGLWIVPAAAILSVLPVLRRRKVIMVLFPVSAALAAAVLAALVLWGARTGRENRWVPVKVEGRRVKINGSNPGIWVVDDGRGTLGGQLVGKDIRSFYRSLPDAPAMGYVTDIADLPEKGVRRLVLAGKAGTDWLVKLSEDEAARNNLPKSVVFVSPPFMPSEITEGVRALCSPTVVLGEFAARYHDEYRQKQSMVHIIPAMEKYILMWPQYVIGE